MPDPTRLLQLFADPRFQLAVETGRELLEPLDGQPYQLPVPPKLELETGAALTLFNRPVSLQAGVEPVVRIQAPGDAAEGLFGDGSSLPPADGRALAELVVDAHGKLEMAVPADFREVTVSAHASAGGELHYRHVVPVNPQGRRLDALLRLARTSRLPQQAQLAEVPPGTAHRLEALLSLDFGLETRVGSDFQTRLAREVFQDLPAALQLSGTATARAAVGLGLHERLTVAVGRGESTSRNPDWVRVRIHRLEHRKLSFGVVVQLQARYDLGSSLGAILTRAFGEIPPLPRAVRTFEEINRVVARGGWDALEQDLDARLADALNEWLDGTGWKKWAAHSPEVQRLLEDCRELVDAYQSLGPRLQGWWDQLLGQVELGPDGPVRRILQELAGLDVDHLDLDDLVARASPRLEDLVELVEAFSGKSLEEIVLAPESGARQLLSEAVAQAQRALAFLDRLENAPGELMARLQRFADRTGIAGSIAFLAENATSLEQVEGYVSERVRDLARRLVGVVGEQLSADDRRKLQEVAQRIQRVLEAPGELEARLQAAVAKLEGELGFSLTLEVDRVSRHTAILDLEVDPAGSHAALHRELEGALAQGSVAGILQALDRHQGEAEEQQADADLPFVLRQCVFQSERIITSAATTLLHLTGLGRVFQSNRRTVSQRIVERELVVEPAEDGGGLRRRGTWSGGYARTEIVNKMTDRTVVRVVARDAGAGGSSDRAFDEAGAAEVDLEVAWLHEDLAIHTRELRALDSLLVELGFTDSPGALAGIQLTDQSRIRFSLSLRLPPVVLDAFLDGLTEAAWNATWLAAARRWFDDHTVWLPAGDAPSVGQGAVLDAVTRSDVFADKWDLGSRDLAAAVGSRGLQARIGNRTVNLDLVQAAGGGEWLYRTPYQPLKGVMDQRAQGLRSQQRVADRLAEARRRRTGAAYGELAETAAAAWRSSVVASNAWPSTLFGLWLIRARVAANDPAALEQVTGVAFLRWQEPTDSEWNGPRGWRLEGLNARVE